MENNREASDKNQEFIAPREKQVSSLKKEQLILTPTPSAPKLRYDLKFKHFLDHKVIH